MFVSNLLKETIPRILLRTTQKNLLRMTQKKFKANHSMASDVIRSLSPKKRLRDDDKKK